MKGFCGNKKKTYPGHKGHKFCLVYVRAEPVPSAYMTFSATCEAGPYDQKAFRKPLKSVPLGLIVRCQNAPSREPHASH